MKRWCIYIDILGFSELWKGDECQALHSLRELMRAIYRIGAKAYPEGPERLFAHQMGDGFAIVSEFGEESLERPIAVAIALMRCVADTGTLAAAAIAEGDHADITACYPREVTDSTNSGIVPLGRGLMTLSKVMGTAFIRAYRLHGDPPGPFLTVAVNHRDRIPVGVTVRSTEVERVSPCCRSIGSELSCLFFRICRRRLTSTLRRQANSCEESRATAISMSASGPSGARAFVVFSILRCELAGVRSRSTHGQRTTACPRRPKAARLSATNKPRSLPS